MTTYLDVSCVVCTVEVKKSLHEYPRKKLATPIEASTTATQPTLKVISDVDKYFQPCKLVQLQNLSKLDWVLFESSIISSSTSKRIVPFGVVEQAWVFAVAVVELIRPFEWFSGCFKAKQDVLKKIFMNTGFFVI